MYGLDAHYERLLAEYQDKLDRQAQEDEEREKNELSLEQLQQLAHKYIAQYKHEIVRDRDWWHGTDEYSFNIHSPDEDGWFNINVYKYDADKGEDDCSEWIDLPRVFLGSPTELEE
jgi:hypothetical protein